MREGEDFELPAYEDDEVQTEPNGIPSYEDEPEFEVPSHDQDGEVFEVPVTYEVDETLEMLQKKKNEDIIEEENCHEKELRFRRDVNQDVDKFEGMNETIRRGNIPESDDEDEDELSRKKRRLSCSKGEAKLIVGSTFFSGLDFKEAIIDYVLETRYNIKQDRWDKEKLSFKCAMGGQCLWRVYASFDKPRRLWIVKTSNLVHKCIPNGKCQMFHSPVIARVFLDKLRYDPGFMPEKIQEYIKNEWKIVSTKSQCQRGRLTALKMIRKEHEDQFTHLRGYMYEVKHSNPGTTCLVETMKNAAGEDVFDKFYVCFEILRTSWRGCCRPIIGLDGTFLKTAVKGVLLSAIGHNANNQIYPIAWAVCQSENAETWLWFIQQLKKDLELGNGEKYIIISDRSRGLISAVKSEIPQAEHRMCVKHIVENLKKNHGKKDLLKPMVWSLAWSYSKEEYLKNLRKIREYDMDLYNAVMKEDPKSWCLAFYKLGFYCEDVDNNATESFNASIRKARSKSLVQMLETIRRQAMCRITKRQKKANNHSGVNSIYVRDVLTLERDDADKCVIYKSTHGLYEVELKGNSNRVSLPARTCTCLKWQVSGIPCEHAYGAIIDEGLNVDEFVSPIFGTVIWRMLYERSLVPLRGPEVWMYTNCSLIKSPPPPPLPGRKKLSKEKKYARIRGKTESPKKRTGKEVYGRKDRIMHCKLCKKEGHNSATCEKNLNKKVKKRTRAAQ